MWDSTALAPSLWRVPPFPTDAPRSPQRTWAENDGRPHISYLALPARATCAVLLKENRMKSIDATGLHRKSGGKPSTAFRSRPYVLFLRSGGWPCRVVACGRNFLGDSSPHPSKGRIVRAMTLCAEKPRSQKRDLGHPLNVGSRLLDWLPGRLLMLVMDSGVRARRCPGQAIHAFARIDQRIYFPL
jgi:hypothetical protein